MQTTKQNLNHMDVAVVVIIAIAIVMLVAFFRVSSNEKMAAFGCYLLFLEHPKKKSLPSGKQQLATAVH